MQIFVQMKPAGVKRVPLELHPYLVPDSLTTLRTLIEAMVRAEVVRYNSQARDPAFCRFLSRQDLQERSETGRVSFGRIYSERRANADEAVATALLAFEDGLFRTVVGDTVIEALDTPLYLKEGDTVTFVRLIFLAGSFW